MSAFECPVVRVRIEPHPNADAIELAYVGDFVSIVRKGQFKTGDLAVYIPEQSLVPQWLLEKMQLWDDLNGKGKLSGSTGTRVKAIKLRGTLSQGLLLGGVNIGDDYTPRDADDPIRPNSLAVGGPETSDGTMITVRYFTEGEDASEFLGVEKWEQAIPASFNGKVAGAAIRATVAYDFENIKKQPDLFPDGIEVVVTEKIHGTLLQVGLVPKRIWEGEAWADKLPTLPFDMKPIVTSKGLGARGLILDVSDISNLYVNVALSANLFGRLLAIHHALGHPHSEPMFMFGEIFGAQNTEGGPKGIQDLTYDGKLNFRAFDIYCGERGKGYFLSYDLFLQACDHGGIGNVPQLYRGPYSKEIVLQHTDGNTTLTDKKQIREGVVVKATNGSLCPRYGTRRIAKSISEAYLMRKGDTTEFQ
jgi:RNA ligase (TIGR02306 family)